MMRGSRWLREAPLRGVSHVHGAGRGVDGEGPHRYAVNRARFGPQPARTVRATGRQSRASGTPASHSASQRAGAAGQSTVKVAVVNTGSHAPRGTGPSDNVRVMTPVLLEAEAGGHVKIA